MIDVTEDISQPNKEMDRRYSYELLEEYNNFFPTPEDEVIGLEFLLAEPGCSDDLVEPFLGVNLTSSLTCVESKEKQDQKNICNGKNSASHTMRRGDQYHSEDNDQVHVIDEGILQEMNNLPSICEDYLFDCKMAGEVSILGCDSFKVPLINQPSEFKTDNGKEHHDSEGKYSNGSAEMVNESLLIFSDLVVEGGRLSQSSARLSNKSVKPEVIPCGNVVLHGDSIATFSSMVTGNSLSFTNNDACFTKKRSRKCPQRYIDEYSKYHSVHTNKRSEDLSKNTREKTASMSCLNCNKDVKERTTVCYNEYITEPIQVPFGPLMGRDCSKQKEPLSPDYDLMVQNKAIVKFSKESTCTELSLNPSQDNKTDDYELEEVTKDKSGRKHNRYWSEYEIAKLIEGVARFGVGKWTEIRRGLFPPATRRTAVDLKDKWRNLLKACRGQLHRTNEGRRITHQQVSQSVLRQVKELAKLYPYPKVPSRKNAVFRC